MSTANIIDWTKHTPKTLGQLIFDNSYAWLPDNFLAAHFTPARSRMAIEDAGSYTS